MFQDYVDFTRTTAIYPTGNCNEAIIYLTLGLASEAGEVAGVLKKCLRDDHNDITPEVLSKLEKELGDVMWYIARITDELGLDLNDILELNKTKLTSRLNRNKLTGEGDDR
jgi:NTP pyrophosphatase (non-canonical NTP hydrolase)